jgi:polar amino acid transport system substrate-binding protein
MVISENLKTHLVYSRLVVPIKIKKLGAMIMKLKNVNFTRKLFLTSVLVTGLSLGMGVDAASTLDAIKNNGEISVGTEAHYPPMEFLDDGKIVGYGKDILDLVVADLGVKLNQLDLPWQGILPGVLAKKFDLVATSVSITPERAEKYAFTMPIAEYQTMLIQRGDDSMSELTDLNGKVVGTELGSVQVEQLEEVNKQLKAASGQGFEVKAFTSTDDMRLAIANGQVDAGTIPSISLGILQKRRPGLFKSLVNIGDVKLFSWVTHPDSQGLRESVSKSILKIRDSGKMKELQMKWFGFEMNIPSEGYLPAGSI